MDKIINIGIGALVFHKDKLLLCKSRNKWAKKWLIPGGKMKFGESIEETIYREIKEETDLEIENIQVKNVQSVVNPKEYTDKNAHFIMIDVTATTNITEPKLNEEHSKFKWVTPEEALKMDLLPYSRTPIEKYLENQQKNDYLEGWKRCMADFKNYKEKVDLMLSEREKRAKEDLILEFLPILDNFNLASEHVPKNLQNEGWVQGLFYIKKQFEDIIGQLGISEILAKDEPFNPQKHECIEEVKVEEKNQKGKVIEILQKGYKWQDKIIRPAKVRVGK